MPDLIVEPIVAPIVTDKPWYDGADPETIGYLQNRGWDKVTASQAAIEAGKAHREAERLIGAPASEMIRMPKADAPEAERIAMWQRLGAPADPKDYDFTGVDPALADAVRATAAAAHLPKDAATQVATGVAKYLTDKAAGETAERAAALQTERETLQKSWGNNFETNKFIAGQAAQKLGVDPAAIAALEGQVGYGPIMEMFRKIGMSLGEDKFVNNGPAGGDPALATKESAIARKTELKADQGFVTRYLAGDREAVRQMKALDMLIAGESDLNYEE